MMLNLIPVRSWGKFLLPVLSLLLPGIHVGAQSDSTRPRFFDTPIHFESGLGVDIAHYRDFATSPLNYWGAMAAVPLSLIRMNDRTDIELTIRNSYGAFVMFYGDEITPSSAYVNNFQYSHLFRIKNWSGERWNFKAGATYDFTTIIRVNPSLLNNASGYEMFSTLSGSFSVRLEASRKQMKEFKLIFLPVKLKPRKRLLTFRLDVGALNANVRNGYAYIGQDAVLGRLGIFDGYEINLLSGFRMGSRLDYFYYLKNQNAFRFSYLWDAYMTGGDLPAFEMAHHILQFSLLFKLN
ncbi:MAG: hypothetical protein JW801_16860 [Bacteroidales bacterium]|nr:hypothetical protein [Bacteroidales bacterium]